MFIEGLTKDRSWQIRSECAQGLAQIGSSTFRTLLLGLHDPDPRVRESTSNAIIRNMNVEDIEDSFRGKDH
jgi:HEAT repeat protein